MQSDNIDMSKLIKTFKVRIIQILTKENMKKIVITLFLVLFTSSVYAGSCPMMAKSLDDKIVEAQTLRDKGVAAHDAGDHAKSEELLNKAMELFKS
jgi:hypothetical protein